MPSAIATLIRDEIRGEDIRLAIRSVTTANKRFGQIQIVVGATQRSRSLKLTSIECHRELCPSLTGRFLIDLDPLGPRGTDRNRRRRLLMAGETPGLAEELR